MINKILNPSNWIGLIWTNEFTFRTRNRIQVADHSFINIQIQNLIDFISRRMIMKLQIRSKLRRDYIMNLTLLKYSSQCQWKRKHTHNFFIVGFHWFIMSLTHQFLLPPNMFVLYTMPKREFNKSKEQRLSRSATGSQSEEQWRLSILVICETKK